jgi:NAD(P)-dependent dehydrogenase (short-subunit alcohol dehydrogenase family)
MSDYHMKADLSGQVAFITGGGRGLGRAYAQALAAAGARVAVAARSADQLDETLALIKANGGEAAAFPLDVTNAAAVKAGVEAAEATLGPIDLLINNAGVGLPLGPVWETDPEAWWRTMEVNVRGPMLVCHAVLPGMVARRQGRIINVSSGAGNSPIPYFSAYVTSKAALTRLTEIIAAETQEYGIHVFTINPGLVLTTMTEDAFSEDGLKWIPWLKAWFDEQRNITPEFSAQLILWLASGQGDALSGRFISRVDDLAHLMAHADEIRQRDIYNLRFGRLS